MIHEAKYLREKKQSTSFNTKLGSYLIGNFSRLCLLMRYLFSYLKELFDIVWPHVVGVGLDGEAQTLPTVDVHLT